MQIYLAVDEERLSPAIPKLLLEWFLLTWLSAVKEEIANAPSIVDG